MADDNKFEWKKGDLVFHGEPDPSLYEEVEIELDEDEDEDEDEQPSSNAEA